MFKRLFGTRESSPTQLTPLPLIGGFDVEVVGESHYQDALAQVCGGRGVESAQYDCTAVLRAEPANPYDPNAIRIEIAGRLVGHLNRHAAEAFKPTADRLAAAGHVGTCHAVIVGGWDRGEGDTGSFGVRLDLGIN